MRHADIFFIKCMLLAVFLMEIAICSPQKKVYLKSIQHHEGNAMGTARLELGTMVLFFSEPVLPIVVHKKNLPDNKIEQRIMFPHVLLQDEQVKAMVTRVNDQRNGAYNITFSMTQAPVQGLELRITYKQQDVLYNYETVVSPSSLPGYIFRFIDQACYNDLVKRVQEKRVTHTAWQKKNHVL